MKEASKFTGIKPSLKDVDCSNCGMPMKISHDSVSGVCWRCVCNMLGKPEE